MEIRKPEIKAMKYEDFNDNEYLEKMAAELRRGDANAFYTDNYTQMFQFTPNDKLSMYVEVVIMTVQLNVSPNT